MSTPLSDFFSTRPPARRDFLARSLADAGEPVLMGEDWGTRRYYRVGAQGQTYILMESVPDHMPFAAPGHRIADFIRLSAALRDAGLHAPAIIAQDADEGYLLLEDMGDESFYGAAQSHAADEASLYTLATDVLIHAATHVSTDGLPRYADTHVHKGRRRVIDWYAPVMRGRMNEDGLADDYLAVWDFIERDLPPCPEGFVHGDYHLQNLMLCGGNGLWRCGILDFQGATRGPLPYDLANLLGDIRRDVSPTIAKAMMAHRTDGMDAATRESFMAWYAVLKAQFHCRVVGQVIRLAVVQGKPKHLAHMPRLQRYMRDGLADPVLAPLRSWFDKNGIAFDGALAADPVAPGALIRPDAF